VQIADASHGVRELVAEIDGLDASAAGGLVDRATWRVAILIVVFFAALAAYRLLVSRLSRRSA
jgi:hypothetical protein